MDIQIKSTFSQVHETGLYQYATLSTGGKEITICLFSGRNRSYFNVTVHNAQQRVSRSLGKEFANKEAALNAYKCPKIKAMINFEFND